METSSAGQSTALLVMLLALAGVGGVALYLTAPASEPDAPAGGTEPAGLPQPAGEPELSGDETTTPPGNSARRVTPTSELTANPGPASPIDERAPAPASPAPRAAHERPRPCPPEGCPCAAEICPIDETCACRVDGSLRSSESVEIADDGTAIHRVTRYDAAGNPTEVTAETHRDGLLVSRETITYDGEAIDRRVRERFDESGALEARMEEDWRDGEPASWRRTRFGPDGEPIRSMQRERGADGEMTMGFDHDGDGEIDRWAVRNDDRTGQLFDAQGNAMGSWETEEDGDVQVRRRRNAEGEVVNEMRTTTDGSTATTEVLDEDGDTLRVVVRDEEENTFDAYDVDGNPVFRSSRNEDGDFVAEAHVEGVWFEMGRPWDAETEYYGAGDDGTEYRMLFEGDGGDFTLAQSDGDGGWTETAICTFDPDCPMRRPPCPYTCE